VIPYGFFSAPTGTVLALVPGVVLAPVRRLLMAAFGGAALLAPRRFTATA
jgi:hypothetical protein